MTAQNPGTTVEHHKCYGRVSKGKEKLSVHQEGIFRKDFLREAYLSYTLKGELALDRRPPSRNPSA